MEITGTAPADLQVGAFANFRIFISNVSDSATLILSVAFKLDNSEGPLDLGRSLRGALRFDSAAGEYIYDPAVPENTSEPLQEGLLLPGQTLIVERSTRLLGRQEEAVVRYLKLNSADLRGEIYLPERETSLQTRFRRPDQRTLRGFQTRTPRSPAFADSLGPESVLASRSLLARPAETASQLIELPVRPPAVPWTEAEKRGRGRGRFLTYCAALGGWIFESEGGHWLVSAGGDRPLPLASPRFYRDLDLNGGFELALDDKTARRIGVAAGSKVDAQAAARVLEAIRTAGLRIERRELGAERWVYEVQ